MRSRKPAYEDIVEGGEIKIEYESFCKALAYIVSMPEDILQNAREKLRAKGLRKRPKQAERHLILYTYRKMKKVLPEVSLPRRKFFLAYVLVYLLRVASCKSIDSVFLNSRANIRLPKQAMEIIDIVLLKLKSLLESKPLQDICPGHFKAERDRLFDILEGL